MSESSDSNRVERLKQILFELQDQRKKIEDELIMHKAVLESNKIGMSESLTDKDDFPRDDIDVWAVRHARSEINRLENDAKSIVNDLQTYLEELHSLTKSTR